MSEESNQILIFTEVNFSNLMNFDKEEKKKIQSLIKVEIANIYCPECNSLKLELLTHLTMFQEIPLRCKNCKQSFYLALNLERNR